MLLQSWLASLPSEHTRANFKTTAERFLDALRPIGLREATVEDVREAAEKVAEGKSQATARQYISGSWAALDADKNTCTRPKPRWRRRRRKEQSSRFPPWLFSVH
jgi:hypothetical protein